MARRRRRRRRSPRRRAMTRYRPRPVRRRRRRRGGSFLSGSGPAGLPVKEAAIAAAAGFVLQPDPGATSFVKKVQDQLNKLPALGNRTVTAGLVVHFGNRMLVKNKWVGALGKAMLIGGAFEFGRKKFTQTDALLGDDDSGYTAVFDADDLEGVLGADDVDDDDDD